MTHRFPSGIPASALVLALTAAAIPGTSPALPLFQAEHVSFYAGVGALSGIVVHDLNGDGNLDVISAQPFADQFAVLFGDGEGGLGDPVLYPTNDEPRSLATGDLNDDGHLDLLLAHKPVSKVSVFLSDAAGAFHEEAAVALAGQPSSLAIGDLNGDGRDDFVVAIGATVRAYLRKAGTGFDEGPLTNLPGTITQVGLADVNSDTVLDLFVLQGTTTLSTLPGSGGGVFGSPTNYGLPGNPGSFVLADYNDDGQPDVGIVTLGNPNAMYQWRGNGSALVSTCGNPFVGSYLGNLSIARLGTGNNGYALGASGIFKVHSGSCPVIEDSYGADCFTGDATSGDMDGDGLRDLVATDSYMVTIRPWATPPGVHHLAAPHSATLMAVGDVDGDGKVDLLSRNSTTVVIQKGNGNGTLSPGPEFDSGPLAFAAELFDLNHDNRLDLVCTGGNFLRVFYNEGAGFGGHQDFGPAYGGIVRAGDFDGDGNLDLVTSSVRDTVRVLFGTGGGSLGRPYQIACAARPDGMTVADVNGDGLDDIVTVGLNLSVVATVLLGQANGTLLRGDQTFPYLINGVPVDATSADVNRDGVPDLIMRSTNTVMVAPGLGFGGFGTRYAVAYLSSMTGMNVADVNLDGIPDLLLSGCGGIKVHLGDGAGGFSDPVSYGAGASLQRAMAADLNGDHSPDLIANDGWTLLSRITNTHAMVAAKTGEGRIWPEGNLHAADGSSWMFGVWPDPGYIIHDLIVDGMSAGPALSHTFSDIHEPHSIVVVFKSNTADVGPQERAALSIEQLRFEPASHTIAVRFALPAPGPARLELFDTSGRLQASRDVSVLGPGRHELSLGEGGRPAPGLYFVRLRQGDRAASGKVVVVY